MKNSLIVASLFLLLGPVVSARDVVKQFNEDAVYTIDTISKSPGPKAIWIIFKNGKYDADYGNAADVLKHFEKQPKEKTKNGIFINSKSYAIPETEVKDMLTPYLRELYHDRQWRDSENALIDELVKECEKRNIQVWVNITIFDNGKSKLLTKPHAK